ncbi:hypothetical protein [Actinophytocola sp.]|uniref:hypothetical protein n=1 Tax=Actinophytocola sp. TaxID=1872138 RepID=UPI002ED08D39
MTSFFDSLSVFGMSGEQIYHNFHGGTGDDAKGMLAAAVKVDLLIKNYNERTTSITDLTTKMESAWQGDAAGAAQRGAGPLAVEHGLAAPSMDTAQSTLTSQANAFSTAKAQVTKIPPTPQEPGVWDNLTSLGGAGRNYENQMNQVNGANDNNVSVMQDYEATSSSNASAMPTTYGRITDDYSAVGVERPSPPPTPGPPPPTPPGTGTPGSSGSGSTGGSGSTLPSGSSPPGTNVPGGGGGGTGRPPGSGGGGGGGGTTNPSNNIPPIGTPPRSPLPGNRPPGSGNPSGNPALPGMMPGFGPTGGGGGGGGGGFGPRGGGGGGGFGPTGSGGGSGGGPGAGGRGVGGFGPGAGGAAAAAEGVAGRGGFGPGGGGAGGGRGGMGGMGGHGGKGQGEEDQEHERPSFLVEPDPHETFGTDEVTAPPVIGE